MNIIHSRFLLFSVLSILVLTSCEKKEYQTIVELDEENIQSYIRQNNLNMVPFGESGMYYEILEEGDGSELDYKTVIPLVYTFKSHDGTFSSADTFAVGNRY